jgi:hypothetical protein
VGDELLLLVRVGFPQEASHLVIAGADAPEQALDAAGGVPDPARLLDPEAGLIGAAEAPRADLLLEPLELSGGEVPWVTFLVEGTQSVQTAVAEQA